MTRPVLRRSRRIYEIDNPPPPTPKSPKKAKKVRMDSNRLFHLKDYTDTIWQHVALYLAIPQMGALRRVLTTRLTPKPSVSFKTPINVVRYFDNIVSLLGQYDPTQVEEVKVFAPPVIRYSISSMIMTGCVECPAEERSEFNFVLPNWMPIQTQKRGSLTIYQVYVHLSNKDLWKAHKAALRLLPLVRDNKALILFLEAEDATHHDKKMPLRYDNWALRRDGRDFSYKPPILLLIELFKSCVIYDCWNTWKWLTSLYLRCGGRFYIKRWESDRSKCVTLWWHPYWGSGPLACEYTRQVDKEMRRWLDLYQLSGMSEQDPDEVEKLKWYRNHLPDTDASPSTWSAPWRA